MEACFAAAPVAALATWGRYAVQYQLAGGGPAGSVVPVAISMGGAGSKQATVAIAAGGS